MVGQQYRCEGRGNLGHLGFLRLQELRAVELQQQVRGQAVGARHVQERVVEVARLERNGIVVS